DVQPARESDRLLVGPIHAHAERGGRSAEVLREGTDPGADAMLHPLLVPVVLDPVSGSGLPPEGMHVKTDFVLRGQQRLPGTSVVRQGPARGTVGLRNLLIG